MNKPGDSAAQQIAEAASAFQEQISGRSPRTVAVVLGNNMLAITLHGVLSPVEQALARSSSGAAEVQDFHRQLFVNSFESLRQEIERITGIEIREAAGELVPTTGAWVKALASGTIVQVYLLAQRVPTEAWSGEISAKALSEREQLSGPQQKSG